MPFAFCLIEIFPRKGGLFLACLIFYGVLRLRIPHMSFRWRNPEEVSPFSSRRQSESDGILEIHSFCLQMIALPPKGSPLGNLQARPETDWITLMEAERVLIILLPACIRAKIFCLFDVRSL